MGFAAAGTGCGVRVIVNANAPVLRVRASRRGGAPFTVNASLEAAPGRGTAAKQTPTGAGFCGARHGVPNTVLSPAAGSGAAGQTVRWFHRNGYALVNQSDNLSNFANTLLHQGVSPAVMPGPFDNLTFGGSLSVSTAQAVVPSSVWWLHTAGAGGVLVAEQKKVRQEQKGKDARKAKRQEMSLAQSVQATLAAAADWKDAFGKLTVAKLTSLGTALGMESVPKGKKAEVAAAVEQVAREWADARPATRAGNG